jgi:hypothetical protein
MFLCVPNSQTPIGATGGRLRSDATGMTWWAQVDSNSTHSDYSWSEKFLYLARAGTFQTLTSHGKQAVSRCWGQVPRPNLKPEISGNIFRILLRLLVASLPLPWSGSRPLPATEGGGRPRGSGSGERTPSGRGEKAGSIKSRCASRSLSLPLPPGGRRLCAPCDRDPHIVAQRRKPVYPGERGL